MGKSILVVLERAGDPAPALRRALQLARRMAARADLCLCEAETAYALQHQFDSEATQRIRQSSAHKAQAWIEREWQAMAAPVRSSLRSVAACSPPPTAWRAAVARVSSCCMHGVPPM